jgi:hypothetical protein
MMLVGYASCILCAAFQVRLFDFWLGQGSASVQYPNLILDHKAEALYENRWADYILSLKRLVRLYEHDNFPLVSRSCLGAREGMFSSVSVPVHLLRGRRCLGGGGLPSSFAI